MSVTDADLVPADGAVETIVVPQQRDLGGFEVRRVLPSLRQRTVGPFVFLDHLGPAAFGPGNGIDVRPHPHIGLATVTYLLKGSILHRDSLGSVQPIAPGAVNWMNAGRGIVHSERTGPAERADGQTLFGLQLWVALPHAQEESEPSFSHYPASQIPEMEGEGAAVRAVAGAGFGLKSPVAIASPLFFFDLRLQPGATVTLPADYPERALYLVDGRVEVGGTMFQPGQMLVLGKGVPVDIRALDHARLVALGGEPLDGPRHLWWNFVSSSKDRIEQAKEDWRRNRFNLPVPGDAEFIPLPA